MTEISNHDKRRNQRRGAWSILTFIPMICLMSLFVSQLAVNNAQITELVVTVRADEPADYSSWNLGTFSPVDPALATQLAILNGNRFVVAHSMTETPDSQSIAEPNNDSTTDTNESEQDSSIEPNSDTDAESDVEPTTDDQEVPEAMESAPTEEPSATPTVIPSVAPTAISPPPVASFTVMASGLTVTVSNLSYGDITSYSWSYGDGFGISALPSPGNYSYVTAGTYTITLTVIGSGGSSTYSLPVTVGAVSDDLTLNLAVNQSSVNPGQSVTITATVSNFSLQTATNTQVNLTLPSGLTRVASRGDGTFDGTNWLVSSIAPSGTATLSIDMIAVTANTTQSIQGQITAQSYADSNPVNNSASVIVTIGASSTVDIAITAFTVDNSFPREGATLSLSLVVENRGAGTATNVVIGAPTGDNGITITSYTPSQGNVSSDQWIIGTLQSSDSVTLSMSASVNPGTGGTTLTRTRSLLSLDQPDSSAGNDSASYSVTVLSATDADMGISINVDDVAPLDGDTITYTIVVTNNGPNNATNTAVNAVLPTGVTYASDSPGQGTYTSGSGVWNVGALSSGTSATLALSATVDTGTNGQTIVHSVSVLATENDPNTSNDSATATINVGAKSDMSIVQTVDINSPFTEDTITYTVTITNNGPSDATGVTVTDVLPAGVTYDGKSQSQGRYRAKSGVWTVGSIPVGATATLTLSANVDIGTEAQTIVNTAMVSANEPDSNATNDSASTSITVLNPADMSVTVSVDNNTPQVSEIITYTVTVSNGGPNNATNVRASDVLPTGVTYVSSVQSQGTYSPSTDIWTIGSMANGTSVVLTVQATTNSSTEGMSITNTVNVTAFQPDKYPANNAASVSILVGVSADMSIAMVVDNFSPNESATINYTLTVSNNGPSTATGVQVSDLLPTGIIYVSDTPSQGTYVSGTGVWDIGSVANGASVTLVITSTVDIGTSGQIITNSADVTANELDSNTANNSAFASILVGTSLDLSIVKTVDNNTPLEGATINYTLTVTNAGPSTATNIQVNDTLPGGVTFVSNTSSQGTYTTGTGIWDVGSVANGGSATLTITVSVNAGTSGQTIVNSATVSASEIDANSGNNSASVSILVGSSADLSMSISVDDSTPNVTESIIYTLTVINNGPGTATGIMANDLLPGGITYVTHTVSQGTYTPGTGGWDIGTLTTGASVTLNITATVNPATEGQTIVNTGDVSAIEPDSNSSNNSNSISIVVGALSDMSITKVVSNATPLVTDTVNYTITLTNNGPSNATFVQVVDLLPTGVTYVSSSPSAGIYTSGTGLWDVGAMANGASATLTIRAAIDPGTENLTITNTADVSLVETDPNVGNNSASASIVVQPVVDLSTTKVVDNGTPVVGNTINYTVTVTNSGPSTATGVQVNDLLPSGITFSMSSPSQGTYTPGTGIWNIGTLANGANATLGIAATINSGTEGQTITNTATVSANETDLNTSNDLASVPIVVGSSADLSMSKTVDNTAPTEGATITYTITVTNSGPSSASNVQVDDLLPTGVSFVSSSSSQGTYTSGTGIWDIGTLANGTSVTLSISASVDTGTTGQTINNTATVSSSTSDPGGGNNTTSVSITVG